MSCVDESIRISCDVPRHDRLLSIYLFRICAAVWCVMFSGAKKRKKSLFHDVTCEFMVG